MSRLIGATVSAGFPRREVMLEPDEVTAMLRLAKLGWGGRIRIGECRYQKPAKHELTASQPIRKP